MDVKETIEKRRSIRKYQNREVSQKIIDELIESARLSPSAYNAQPWKFKIINDKKIIEKMKQEGVFKHGFVYTAPLIIVCCGLEESYPENASENFNLRDLVYGDLGIASQNLVLSATELGLGSCYVGIINREKIKKILDISEDYIIPYVITLGYSDECFELLFVSVSEPEKDRWEDKLQKMIKEDVPEGLTRDQKIALIDLLRAMFKMWV